MRLTEEIIELLKSLEQGTALSVAHDIIEEAEHEGWITCDSKLTDSGHQILHAIRTRLLSSDQLKLHEQARVAYISQHNYARFQKLLSFGLSAGVPIELKQRFPSFVLQCEETQIALEEDIARDIFVWREDGS
jgi:DtxR family transcriptional regulator, Mn-dependent transcriptional regulator